MKLGLVLNPVAGLGGPAGLKGSDGAGVQDLALARGATARSTQRAVAALSVLVREVSRTGGGELSIVTASDAMGEAAVRAAGARPEVVYRPQGRSTGADTTSAVRAMVAAGAELVLFVGGDGTARDVLAGGPPLALGIPAGVKMYSSCFAVGPAAAGALAADVAAGRVRRQIEAEVLDVDEDQVRLGRVDPHLYGYLTIPAHSSRTQARKAPSGAGGVAEAAAAAALEMAKAPDTSYLLGPGSTMLALAARLGLRGTPLGVDVVRDGVMVAADASERDLLELVGDGRARAVVTVIGGQGFLLGRGNQQLSARVIRALGPDPLLVVSTQQKLIELGGRPLLVDTGDAELDRGLSGHVKVITGPGALSVYPVQSVEGAEDAAE